MRTTCRRLLFGIPLLLLLLALAACGTGAAKLEAPDAQTGGTAAPALPAAGAPRNLLRLEVPALAGLQAGEEFEVVLQAETVEPLFQASARLLFDPAQLEPLRSERGRGLPPDQLFVSRADGNLRMEGDGYVPFAFTGGPDTPGLAPGKLELLRVRFRLRQSVRDNAELRLANDPAYLQLRAPGNRRLGFDLSQEVAGR